MLTRLIHRYLSPAESLLEILFGLVMALTMTVGARIVWHEGTTDVADLVLALLGCNLAWGIIDAMFYLLGARYGRNQTTHLIRRLRRTQSDSEALAMIEREIALDETVLTDPADRQRIRDLLARVLRRASNGRAENTASEITGAAVVCVLVAASAIPGVLPLVLLESAEAALQIANGIQVALLFWVGYAWAAYAGAKPLRTGVAIALLGMSLVGIAVVLGG